MVMGETINLKQFKKRAERDRSAKQAETNRARFGRSKSERTSEQQQRERAKSLLDQHRLDDGEAS